MTDSTIAPPPETGDFFNEHFMATGHEEQCYEINISTYFRVCKERSNVDARVAEGHRISGVTAGRWFQNRQFRYRKVGGAIVERLIYQAYTTCTHNICLMNQRDRIVPRFGRTCMNLHVPNSHCEIKYSCIRYRPHKFGPGRAGPGRADIFSKCDEPGRAAAHHLKCRWAGLGRGPWLETLMGRDCSRPIDSKFDGPGQVAA